MQAPTTDLNVVPFKREEIYRPDIYPLDFSTPDHGERPVARRSAADQGAVLGFSLVLLVFAYEWVLSGANKLLSGDFRGGLAGELSDAAVNNPRAWYASFLTSVVIPHAAIFGLMVEMGEMLVGLGLVVAAARWLGAERLTPKWTVRFDLVAIAALAGSAMMSCNFLLMSGDPLPWFNTSAPFNEVVGIDCLLAMIAIGLLVVHAFALRDDRRLAAQEAA